MVAALQGRRALILAASLLVSCALILRSGSPHSLLTESRWSSSIHRVLGWGNTVAELNHTFSSDELQQLEALLQRTALSSRTVILTTLNSAWAAPGGMIELFLGSFRNGNGTSELLDHLLIVALDDAAYRRCQDIHPFCFMLQTDGVDFKHEKFFMSADYLKMMWRRIDFLRVVLEMGYSFVFSDADILWLQHPFEHFSGESDFEIACDHYNGNALDPNNSPNGGFVHVSSNARTIEFYKFWYQSRLSFPGKHDQAVLDEIKSEQAFQRMRIRFLDTNIFANFCEISMSRPSSACTMHANCCKGLDNKVRDLRSIVRDWSAFKSSSDERMEWSSLKCPKRSLKRRNASLRRANIGA